MQETGGIDITICKLFTIKSASDTSDVISASLVLAGMSCEWHNRILHFYCSIGRMTYIISTSALKKQLICQGVQRC